MFLNCLVQFTSLNSHVQDVADCGYRRPLAGQQVRVMRVRIAGVTA